MFVMVHNNEKFLYEAHSAQLGEEMWEKYCRHGIGKLLPIHQKALPFFTWYIDSHTSTNTEAYA